MNNPDLSSVNGGAATHCVIAVDLGGTNMRAAAIDGAGRILSRARRETPKAAEDIVAALVSAIDECREACLPPARAVSVAVPATIRRSDNVMTALPNVKALEYFPLPERLAQATSLPVLLENDANAAALGEFWQGAGREAETIIMVTLGTGVGGGIILNGQLWTGADGTAGEIGHVCVETNGAQCGCGSRGCLEVYSSATAMVRLARQLGAEYSDTSVPMDERLTSKVLYEHGIAGDALALEVFRVMGTYLGVGLASLINILNPELIVIGGGAAAGWDLFIGHVKETIKQRAFATPAERAQLIRAERGDDAGILGAAYLALAGPQQVELAKV
jgi:glucokinase